MRVQTSRTTIRSAALTIALLASVLAGCERPLLTPGEERSQFDRYDAIRNQYAAQHTENEFGERVPNLRGRLSPKD